MLTQVVVCHGMGPQSRGSGAMAAGRVTLSNEWRHRRTQVCARPVRMGFRSPVRCSHRPLAQRCSRRSDAPPTAPVVPRRAGSGPTDSHPLETSRADLLPTASSTPVFDPSSPNLRGSDLEATPRVRHSFVGPASAAPWVLPDDQPAGPRPARAGARDRPAVVVCGPLGLDQAHVRAATSC